MNKSVEAASGDDLSPSYKKSERWRIIKNMTVLSIALMLHFIAFDGAQSLQSSVNKEHGLGTSSLASVYVALMISNIFLPSVFIKWLGCKLTITVSFLFTIPYMAAQFYPKFYTMIPGGLSVGLGTGPMWVACCTYLTVVTKAYQYFTNTPPEVLIVRTFGFLYLAFHFSGIWGNLISSLVLTSGSNITTALSKVNESMIPEICGINYVAASDGSKTVYHQPAEKIYLIGGIYIVCVLAASCLALFGLDSLDRYDATRKHASKTMSGWTLLIVSLKHAKDPYQLLIIPITIWLGLDLAFIASDYTMAYVTCSLGTGQIGYVMIISGLGNAFASVVLGPIIKFIGRLPVTVAVFIIKVSIYITLLTWRPHADQPIVFYAISGIWGFCAGVWLLQINVMGSILFPGRETAAYSNFRMWKAAGMLIAFIYSPLLRTYVKLCILLGLFLVAIIGYLTAEIKHLRKAKSPQEEDCNNMKMTSKNEAYS